MVLRDGKIFFCNIHFVFRVRFVFRARFVSRALTHTAWRCRPVGAWCRHRSANGAKTQSRVRERTEKMNTHVGNDEKRLVE